MAEYRLLLSIDPRNMGMTNTTTLRASGIILVTGNGGVHGGIDSMAATPTNDAPLVIAVALTSWVNSCISDLVLILA